MNRCCIAPMRGKIITFLLDESGHALEIHGDETQGAILGNIYVGRVQRVVKNIRAAFVEIQPGQVCYLPLEDLRNPFYIKKGSSPEIQQGDELVVQVSRDAIKTKAAALTSGVSLSGSYVILDLGHPGVGVSRKLPLPERERLKTLGEKLLQTVSGDLGQLGSPGIVLRTNAASVSETVVERELMGLAEELYRIISTSIHRTCFSCLYRTPPHWLKRLLSLHKAETERIVVEDEELYRKASAFLAEQDRELSDKLVLYRDDLLPMVKLYSLERELEDALSERVWMRSGAYLVIQPTEALTVVDVNSGKSVGGKKKEEACLKINLEAARETARQMRLRNLSGIIIVDFINMEQEESRQSVMEELRNCLRQDPVQAHVVDMTKLELVELTRKKVEPPLAQQLRRLYILK